MNDRATAEEVVESEPYEIRIRLKPDPEDAELYDTMLRMLAEVARARRYVERVWRVQHPVKARSCIKALRQVERQIAADFERLYDGPVEIDPPPTERPATEPALKEEEENGAMGQTQERININGSDNEPGRLRRTASATWQFVKNPKVWGVGAAIAGIGVVYLIVRAVAGGDETAVVAQLSGQPNGPIGGGDTATSTTVDPAVNG